ncbi:membrane metallo-endopeptidase-like 1 [Favolaschia claudopus]|uniref:Membrane metallo-endopeptidase-like 1 n=1 Tax=Favolaschia claudopus TaxID=2862362 RepID=A0AAW0AM37_9AGAR
MQFNLAAIITAAIVAAAAPATAVTFQAFAGADCTGTVLATSNGASANECVFFTNAGSAKSISFSGIPSGDKGEFYKSGGANDVCTGSPSVVTGSGSGCASAPAGFNLESFQYVKA